MTITDDLLEGARALRDALDALECVPEVNRTPAGHVIIPDDEVTGEYLASLPAGLTLYERELAAARLDNLITIRRETSCFVRLPLSNEHNGKLITYELQPHDGHMHVAFNLSARPVDPNTLLKEPLSCPHEKSTSTTAET